MKLYSRKNQVYKENGRVIKRFEDEIAYKREREMVALLKNADVAVPQMIKAANNTIIYEWIDGVTYHTLVDCFEQKHARALIYWLECYYSATNILRGDVNLRNFIYCEEADKCYGVDFEDECFAGNKETDFGRIIAFAATYDAPFTDTKRHCAKLLLKGFEESNADSEKIKNSFINEIHAIVQRRTHKHYNMDDAVSFWEKLQ